MVPSWGCSRTAECAVSCGSTCCGDLCLFDGIVPCELGRRGIHTLSAKSRFLALLPPPPAESAEHVRRLSAAEVITVHSRACLDTFCKKRHLPGHRHGPAKAHQARNRRRFRGPICAEISPMRDWWHSGESRLTQQGRHCMRAGAVTAVSSALGGARPSPTTTPQLPAPLASQLPPSRPVGAVAATASRDACHRRCSRRRCGLGHNERPPHGVRYAKPIRQDRRAHAHAKHCDMPPPLPSPHPSSYG